MSYNKRNLPKRGGRNKSNFTDNAGSRRTNADSQSLSYAAQLRPVTKPLNIETNNTQNISNFYENPTTLYILCKYFLGNFVTVKTDDEELNGVLKAVSPNGDFCLTEATVFTHNVEFIIKNEKFKMIPIKDITVVNVKNVDSEHMTHLSETDKIPTDDEIAKLHRSRNGGDKSYNESGSHDVELTPFYDGHVLSDDNCLNANKIGAHWFPPEEMFEKNKTRFNVQSSFSEDLEGYTTKLHKDDPNYKKDLMMAHIKAKEIEKDRDHNFNDLENDDETNEEDLFCSVSRTTGSPHNALLKNKLKGLELKVTSSNNVKDNDESIFTLSQDSNDPKHNLNPNAREFTPTADSDLHYDFSNLAIHVNPMNLQSQGSFLNFIQPTNMMPYPVSVVFPPSHPNQIPLMHNPAMDQFLIPRSNFVPNYPLPPFLFPNQCQIAFDPNMITPVTSNCKYENNFQNVIYSSSSDVLYERDSNQNEGSNRAEVSESSQMNEEIRKEDPEYLKQFGDEILREQSNNVQDIQYSPAQDQNYDSNDSSLNYNKMSSHSQKMYSQVMTANPPAFIFPAQGIRNMGNYQQMIPNQMSYIPNYFSRPSNSIVGPVHQMLPANMIHSAQLPQTLPFHMKPIPHPPNNFQTSFQPTPSFMPVMNHQIGGQNFQTAFIPGYPPSLSAPMNNAQIQIPLHPNMHPQFSPYMTSLQPCNFFTPMPTQPPMPIIQAQPQPPL